MQPYSSEEPSETKKVISPFAQTTAIVSPKVAITGKLLSLISLALLLLIGGALAGIYGTRYVNDSYRSLPNFPVSKYFDDYQSLVGSTFRAELRVDTDLGWKEGGGRLMLFTVAAEARPIGVLVPATVNKDIYFAKGQIYISELEVKEGGLIYANSCKKD